ncbi:MAG: hypothetical protein ABI317_12830 [Gaiellales bacterium]
MTTPLIAARAAYGTALLLTPGLLTRALPGADARTVAFARVLGARHLVEATILWHHRSARWLAAGSAVDAIHALTMLAIALRLPERRTSALANTFTAATLAGLGALETVRVARAS